MKARSSLKAPICCRNSPVNWFTSCDSPCAIFLREEEDWEEAPGAGGEDWGSGKEEGTAAAALVVDTWLG